MSNAEAERRHYTAGLRALADFYDAHPEIATPEPEHSVYSMNEKEEAAAVVRALGKCEKRYADNMFYISREFGPITLKFVFYRSAVCVRKVVAVEEVPEEVIPERVVPAHKREIVEWECEPILASSPVGAESTEGA